MKNTLLQRLITITILHFTLCCAIAIGCDCGKGSVNKSTTITIVPDVAKVPVKNADKEGTNGSNQDKGKDDNDDDDDDDDDITKQVEEKCIEAEKKLDEEDKFLQKQETVDTTITDYGPSSIDDPPPLYSNYEGDSNLPLSGPYRHLTRPASEGCTDSNQNHNYIWDNDDLEDLAKKPSFKRQFIEGCKKHISNIKLKVQSYRKIYRYQVKEKLEKLEGKKITLEKNKNVILKNSMLSSEDRKQQLENNLIKIAIIEYKINYWENIIQKKKNNDKPATSSNEGINTDAGRGYPSAPPYPMTL